MKRTTTIVLAVFIALSMTACDALDAILQVNVFAPFAAVSAGEIAGATSDELLELSGSSSFYETLAESDEAKDAVLDTIDAAIADPATPPADKQELIVLAAQIELQTTPAGDLINNIGGLLDDFMSGSLVVPAAGENDLWTLIQDIIPASVLSESGAIDVAAFIAMINVLVEANDYYEQLGAAIGTDGYAADADVSAGDVAQSALVAALVSGVTVPAGYDSTGDYLFALATQDPAAPASDFTLPDMETGYLANLLAAANLSFGTAGM